jgi:hypothetical protein
MQKKTFFPLLSVNTRSARQSKLVANFLHAHRNQFAAADERKFFRCACMCNVPRVHGSDCCLKTPPHDSGKLHAAAALFMQKIL